MIKIRYAKHLDSIITTHEDNMLYEYTKHLLRFQEAFIQKGCTLRTGILWKIFPSSATFFQRCAFQAGYECYVYCVVEKDGKEEVITSMDGEADFYPLSSAWLVSSIHRTLTNLYVSMYSDLDDVDDELRGFLEQITERQNNTIIN